MLAAVARSSTRYTAPASLFRSSSTFRSRLISPVVSCSSFSKFSTMTEPDYVIQQQQTINRLRRAFASGKTRPIEWRLQQLEALRRCLRESEDIFIEALHKDLHKHASEVKLTEFAMVYHDIELAVHNLQKWIKPINVEKPNLIAFGLDTTQLVPEPYGLVLEIAPWNYPVQLALVPMIGSIAAGNCMILKPSEVGVHCERAFREVLPRYLDNDCFAVICGGPQETQALLENQFDYIFYTGSTFVGKIVMAAAAKHLTPVTLELGGKSPTIVDDTCDLTTAARRIAWGKWVNAGQSCIAPDYILVQENVEKAFVEEVRKALHHFFGEDAQKSDSYGRIVANRHWKRLAALIDSDTVLIGGKMDENDLYIEPTVVKATASDAIMQDEIFGPILPILTIPNVETAIDFINQRPKPLACYIFSNNKNHIDRVLYNTSSGAFVSNDTMMQASVNTLPFGGVGPSGIGGYHGKFSFDTFSHMKPVVKKYPGLEFANEARYAPYSESKFKQIAMVLGYPTKPSTGLSKTILVGVGLAVVLGVASYFHLWN